jgi:hypothetical protein
MVRNKPDIRLARAGTVLPGSGIVRWHGRCGPAGTRCNRNNRNGRSIRKGSSRENHNSSCRRLSQRSRHRGRSGLWQHRKLLPGRRSNACSREYNCCVASIRGVCRHTEQRNRLCRRHTNSQEHSVTCRSLPSYIHCAVY